MRPATVEGRSGTFSPPYPRSRGGSRKNGRPPAFLQVMEGSRGRRRWLAVTGMFVACALALPAVAGAGEVDDACRANGGSASMCVGMEKVGERVSAECRRLGAAPDEQCVVPLGHRVIR